MFVGMGLFSKKSKELKKFVVFTVALGLCIAPSAAQASAGGVFKNCTTLRVKYPNGVAKSAADAKTQKSLPKVSAAIYKSNIKMDRDKDGTICEK